MNFYLSLSLTLACAGFASGDFIKTTFFLSSTKCSGNVYQTVSQLVGCTPQGPKNSLSITCLNSSGATAAVYSTLDCSGPSRSIDVPFDSSCSASGAQSWLTQCVTGSYTPSKGVNLAYYAGPPNTCPAPKGAVPEHFQDITTNICLQGSPTSWIKFGCNAENVTQSGFSAKGCTGTPTSIIPALPLGCSPSPGDPSKPDPNPGLRVVVCGKKQQGQQQEGEDGTELGISLPLPMEDTRTAVTSTLSQAVAAAVVRALQA